MIDDPAEALDILLEELKRQKAAGLRRVSVSDEAVATLKALAGAPVAAPAPAAVAKPSAIAAPAASRPSTPRVTRTAGARVGALDMALLFIFGGSPAIWNPTRTLRL